MYQLLLGWDNWGAEITGETSQLSKRCDGHKIDRHCHEWGSSD